MSRAFDAFSRHGHLTGNTTSRFRAGFFHATGFGGVTPIDQKQALLEWTFSAYGPNGDGGGSKFAQMALGYRYWMGIGVNENCMAALDWYQAAADEGMKNYTICEISSELFAGMRKFRQGPPGGRTLPYPAVRLSDLAGGVYGYGSSAASTGIMAARAVIKSMISSKAGEGVKDLIEYFQARELSAPSLVANPELVQCRSERPVLHLPIREDILPRIDLLCHRRGRVWRRGCLTCSS
jgi:SEL1 protein